MSAIHDPPPRVQRPQHLALPRMLVMAAVVMTALAAERGGRGSAHAAGDGGAREPGAVLLRCGDDTSAEPHARGQRGRAAAADVLVGELSLVDTLIDVDSASFLTRAHDGAQRGRAAPECDSGRRVALHPPERGVHGDERDGRRGLPAQRDRRAARG